MRVCACEEPLSGTLLKQCELLHPKLKNNSLYLGSIHLYLRPKSPVIHSLALSRACWALGRVQIKYLHCQNEAEKIRCTLCCWVFVRVFFILVDIEIARNEKKNHFVEWVDHFQVCTIDLYVYRLSNKRQKEPHFCHLMVIMLHFICVLCIWVCFSLKISHCLNRTMMFWLEIKNGSNSWIGWRILWMASRNTRSGPTMPKFIWLSWIRHKRLIIINK